MEILEKRTSKENRGRGHMEDSLGMSETGGKTSFRTWNKKQILRFSHVILFELSLIIGHYIFKWHQVWSFNSWNNQILLHNSRVLNFVLFPRKYQWIVWSYVCLVAENIAMSIYGFWWHEGISLFYTLLILPLGTKNGGHFKTSFFLLKVR